jgi:hypothetical protein
MICRLLFERPCTEYGRQTWTICVNIADSICSFVFIGIKKTKTTEQHKKSSGIAGDPLNLLLSLQ